MDVKKAIAVIFAACLIFMMVYLTFFRSKKPETKKSGNTPDAAVQKENGQKHCADYERAVVKTSRTIKNSAVWDYTGGAYVVTGDLIIGSKAVFEVKPGVVVKFKGKNTNFIVRGKLVAKGTAENPVVFTSFKDDSAGGDTNCDESETRPAKGDYGSIIISGKKSISGCEFRYAAEIK